MFNNIHREERRIKRARRFFRCSALILTLMALHVMKIIWDATQTAPDIMLKIGGYASFAGAGLFCGATIYFFYVEFNK
tara:strand:+ start:507 stop:740 length:234 start_codon:yes stop_codon:yes gene_type:complete